MAHIPNETWIRIFSYIADTASLRALVFTSWRFHNLAVDELVRTIAWNSVQKAKGHLEFWEKNQDRCLFPRTLAISGTLHRDAYHLHPAILDYSSRFSNLAHLSLCYGTVPFTFYEVLLNLSHLTHLSLDSCSVSSTPPHFPYSFPSFGDVEAPVRTITVTHLCLRGGMTFDFADDSRSLLDCLPQVHSLTTGNLSTAHRILPQISSLTLIIGIHEDDVFALIGFSMPHLMNVVNLTVSPPLQENAPGGYREAPIFCFPQLRTFHGPSHLAGRVLGVAANVEDVIIATDFEKIDDALRCIELLDVNTTRRIVLNLKEWDDEALLAITQRLTRATFVQINYQFSAPSDDFLFNVGIHWLPLLPNLQTLCLYSVPVTATQSESRRGKTLELPETRVTVAPPDEQTCFEYLAAWNRYNPNLRHVQFSNKMSWSRSTIGARWLIEPAAQRRFTFADVPLARRSWIDRIISGV